MVDISDSDWSETDASNTQPSPNGWQNGTFFNQVEPIGRATMGAIKRFWDRINSVVTTTGSSGTYTYTPTNTSYPTAYVQGETYSFKADKASAGNDVININILGAINIYKATPAGIIQIAANDIVTGAHISGQIDTSLNSSAGGFLITAGLSQINTSSFLQAANNLSDVASASTARTNIGAAASGANTDITSLNAPALGAATATTQALDDSSNKVATTQFVNPANSFSTSGYQKFGSGLIIQWATFITSAGGFTNWTFPIAFPTALFQVTGTIQLSGSTGIAMLKWNPAASNTSVASLAAISLNNILDAHPYSVIAIGY